MKMSKEEKHTESIPQPVGMNAKMEANMSVIVSEESATATDIPAIANRNATPCTNRKISWKFTDIFWLNVKSCQKKTPS